MAVEVVRKYDAVFLDAQGTLLHARPSIAGIYADVCRRCGGTATDDQISAAMSEQWTELRASEASQTTSFNTSDEITKRWWADFNAHLFTRLGMVEGREDFLEGLWEAFGWSGSWELFPEATDVLVELRKRGYRLGVVSNWDSRLLLLCRGLGLAAHVDFILASAATGMEKPDRRIFEVALSRARVSPERAVHVGDDYRADVLGARGAGIDAILIDRDGLAPMPVSTIHSLRELLDLL